MVRKKLNEKVKNHDSNSIKVQNVFKRKIEVKCNLREIVNEGKQVCMFGSIVNYVTWNITHGNISGFQFKGFLILQELI